MKKIFPFPSSGSVILFIVAIGFLAFVGGVAAIRYEWTPSQWVSNAMESAEAWYQVLVEPELPMGLEGLNYALAHPEVTWDRARAANGYTLIAMRYSSSAYLLDMEGGIRHQWHIPFGKVWPDPTHVSRPKNEANVYIVKASLFPNGDLLAIFTSPGDTPYGYGMAKVDKDSNVLWTYDAHVHHDAYIDQENGNIYTLTHRMADRLPSGLRGLPLPLLEDFIVVLSPEGKELNRLSIAEALRDSPFGLMLYHAPKNVYFWDHFHTNSVMKLEPSIAAKFPMFKAGQILISVRNMNMVAVVDLSERKVVWAYNGLWRAQHAAAFLDNGHILLLDNKGHIVNRQAYSRLIEFDPATLQVTWHYMGNRRKPFSTNAFGRVQRLSNGNTLAADALNQRLFEVTPQGDIVWEYRLPKIYFNSLTEPTPRNSVPCRDVCPEERLNMFQNRAGVFTNAERYTEDSLPFLGKSMITYTEKETQNAAH